MKMVQPMATGEDKEWQAESDLRALIEAEKIKRDEPRMRAAMEKRKAMADALANIKGDS
ncbi:MAG: hypothetical protein Q8P46_00435 [Hyphomicrobiales bacterium]|nr:hypothetical protein [Hyphomicrobiales bacterium]